MALDIFNIEPNVVTKDLRGKIVTFYGSYKSGKTYNACKFPKPLLLAFEKGYGAIPGVKAAPMNKWSDFKLVLKQLEKPEAKEMYETIILDIVDIAYSLCEQYIVMREGKEKIADIPFGGGYKMLRDEFFNALRKIPMMGYGLIMISHSIEKTMTTESGKSYEKTFSTLNDRCKEIVFGMSDINGYAKVGRNDQGANTIFLYMRETEEFEAGSRFRFTPDYIEFTYNNLVNCIADAIEQEEVDTGIKSVNTALNSAYQDTNAYDFDELMSTATKLCKDITKDNPDNGAKIVEIVEGHLGKGKKLSQCTKDQVDIVALIVTDLKELIMNQ